MNIRERIKINFEKLGLDLKDQANRINKINQVINKNDKDNGDLPNLNGDEDDK